MTTAQSDASLDLVFQFTSFLLSIIAILIIQWIIQKIIDSRLKKIKRIPLEVINLSKILVKILTLASILFIIVSIFKIPAEQVVGLSALLGAIISFGSTQTIANFIAGLYILFTHPFGVNDFIALGNYEIKGEVVEISLNYTRIRTINNIYHYIPNKEFLTTNIVNFNRRIKRRIGSHESNVSQTFTMKTLRDFALRLIEEEVVSYTFLWGTPLGNLSSTKQKLQEVCDIYTGVFGYKPEFFLYSLAYRMQFLFVVTTHNPQILTKNIQEFRDEIVSRFH